VGVQEGGDQALVLGRGDRARRVDKHAARTERAGAGRRGSRPACAPSRAIARGSPASAGRRAPAACRAPSRADRRARGRTPPPRALARRRRRPRRGRWGVQPLRGARELAGPARLRSTATPRRALHQRRQMGALAAGRRAQVEHALAGERREHARHEHRRARLRQERARAPRGEPWASNGPPARAPRGSRGRRCVAHGQLARERGGVGDERVRAQRHLAARCRGHQRTRLLARATPTTGARSTPGGSA
jgi:hypothetical protein